MITFGNLSWDNMFSYGSGNTINLNNEPITQLVGLNGHGKSSIPLILEEVLFNKNSKGIKKGDIVNRLLGTNKYAASLDFTVFRDSYHIDISRSGATQKVKLSKNGSDISSHTATDTFKQLEKLLAIDFKTFSQIGNQNSASSLQFLTATDTARKNFLIDLLSLERYVKIFEEVKKLHKVAADALLTIQTRVSTVKSWLDANSSIELTEKPLLDTPVFEDIQPAIHDLRVALSTIENTNKRISNNEEYIRILSKLDKESLSEELPKPVDYKHLEADASKHKFIIDTKVKTIQKYSGLTEGTCPTCYQEIDTSRINTIISEANEELGISKQEYADIMVKIAEAKAINAKVAAHQRLVEEFEKYSNLIDESLPKLMLDKQGITKQLNDLTTELNAQALKLKEVNRYNNDTIAHNAKVLTIASQIDRFKEDLSGLTAELVAVEDNLALLEVMKKAFSTNGLLAYKIENSVKDLESLTNDYLAELSDGRFQLEFKLNNDKLNIVIIDNGISIEIAALSAGELARVTTSTLLAIRRLMSSLSKCQINVLFLDETIETLDAGGKEKLIEVLLNEHSLNTMLVSHSYSHPLISKINVVKENGISRLENG